MTSDGDDNAEQNTAGPVANVSANGLNITVHSQCNAGLIIDGAAVVMEGYGVGQVRRIVNAWYKNLPGDPPGPCPSGATHGFGCRDWFTIDQAFDEPLDLSSSIINFLPFRGENVFKNQQYSDTGVFQFWGTAIKSLVTGQIHERIRGIAGWGQWNSATNGTNVGGYKALPNLMNEFIGNIITDGVRVDHRGGQGGTVGHAPDDLPGRFGDGPQFGAVNLGIMPGTSGAADVVQKSLVVDRLIAFREN